MEIFIIEVKLWIIRIIFMFYTFVLYICFIIFFIIFVSSYFILIYHSIELYVIMILLVDAMLLIFYNFLSTNQYILVNIRLNFEIYY